MLLSQLDPFVRFAAGIPGSFSPDPVRVTDCRLFYVLRGQATLYIDDQALSLTPNCLFYCNGGSRYQVIAREPVQLLCLNFDLDRTHCGRPLPLPVYPRQDLWDTMPVHTVTVDDSDFLNTHLFLADASWLREPLTELIASHKEGTPLSRALCDSLLKTLLLRLHGAKRRQMPEKLQIVQDYIQKNYARALTNQELGELVGYHPYYLNRTFCAYTGMRLHEYLIKVRMEQAAQLVLDVRLPLQAVAEAVGIHSYPHFSACFKEAFGCSPSHYRLRQRQGL